MHFSLSVTKLAKAEVLRSCPCVRAAQLAPTKIATLEDEVDSLEQANVDLTDDNKHFRVVVASLKSRLKRALGGKETGPKKKSDSSQCAWAVHTGLKPEVAASDNL